MHGHSHTIDLERSLPSQLDLKQSGNIHSAMDNRSIVINEALNMAQSSQKSRAPSGMDRSPTRSGKGQRSTKKNYSSVIAAEMEGIQLECKNEIEKAQQTLRDQMEQFKMETARHMHEHLTFMER